MVCARMIPCGKRRKKFARTDFIDKVLGFVIFFAFDRDKSDVERVKGFFVYCVVGDVRLCWSDACVLIVLLIKQGDKKSGIAIYRWTFNSNVIEWFFCFGVADGSYVRLVRSETPFQVFLEMRKGKYFKRTW